MGWESGPPDYTYSSISWAEVGRKSHPVAYCLVVSLQQCNNLITGMYRNLAHVASTTQHLVPMPIDMAFKLFSCFIIPSVDPIPSENCRPVVSSSLGPFPYPPLSPLLLLSPTFTSSPPPRFPPSLLLALTGAFLLPFLALPSPPASPFSSLFASPFASPFALPLLA